MSLSKIKQDWEALGELDPCWAVLTSLPKGQSGEPDFDAFFRTGEEEIASVIQKSEQLGRPSKRELVLDFGCGLGRLTRALSTYFSRAVGVDISSPMIARARDLNQSATNCEFVLNTSGDLRQFPDNHFDMIYTARVLQHIPTRATIKAYLGEFVRVLNPGGLLVFQLPSFIRVRNRIQPRRRLYAFLKTLGVSEKTLLTRLSLSPMHMTFIPKADVLDYLAASGAGVLDVHPDLMCGPTIESHTYYVTKPGE
jgi:ubiquinone/menaquinone biosynthesis C-methylase UbiE